MDVQDFSPRVQKYLRDNLPKTGERLIAKLIDADRRDPTIKTVKGHATGVMNTYNPNSKSFVGHEVFLDPDQDSPKPRVLLKYVVRENTEFLNGSERISEVTGYIDFNSKGRCIARYNERSKCIFLLLSSQNKDNPFRIPHFKAEWTIVKNVEDVQEDDFHFHLVDRAIEILNSSKHDKKMAIATELAKKGHKQFTGRQSQFEDDPKFLTNQLRRFVDQHPEDFVIAAKDVPSMKKIQIKQAKEKFFLKFDEGTYHSWYLENDRGEKIKGEDGKPLLCKVESIEDKNEALEKFISLKPGESFYRAMTMLLKEGKSSEVE